MDLSPRDKLSGKGLKVGNTSRHNLAKKLISQTRVPTSKKFSSIIESETIKVIQ